MKISYNWLSNYVAPMPTTDELAVLLTAVGLEVEDLYAYESLKGGLAGVVVGEVLTCEKHPGADKLHVTTVSIGGTEPLAIVCGAPNVAAGQKVPVALVGTTLYPQTGEPITLKKAKIRGELSEGMICAEDELGIGNSHAGIIVFPADTAVGIPVASLFGVYTDTVYEIGLTPNRSDAFSHYGVAREVVAYMQLHHGERNTTLLPLPTNTLSEAAALKADAAIKVTVANPTACPRYCGLSLSNIQIGESPLWMQHYLKSIGLRPINNVVDITNFVLHESGQPLHAFDAETINGKELIVRNATASELFVTLDQQEVKLKESDLVIADTNKALCIAGVMGGSNSGVQASTTEVFLECAWFHPTNIRNTSTRLNLRTDAALHFEKRIDSEMAPTVILRAAQLLIEHAGASLTSSVYNSHPEALFETQLRVRYQKINDLIGVTFEPSTVKNILQNLGFEVLKEEEAALLLKVPSHKTDMKVEADIIEEIVRMYGLDNIPMPISVTASIPINAPDKANSLKEQLSNLLTASGCNQMLNNSITKSAYYSNGEKEVKLLNSLTTELDMLRQNLVFGGLEVVAYNLNRRQDDQLWFEWGKVYTKQTENYLEREILQLISTGNKQAKNWQSDALKADFYWMKELVSKIASKCGAKTISFEAVESDLLSNAFTIVANKIKVGIMGEVKEEWANKFAVKQAVWSTELDWSALLQLASKKQIRYKEISKFPAIQRDLSVVVEEAITYQQLESIATKIGGPLLKQMDLFDIYKDKKIGENKKSYAISLLFQDENATLTDDKIEGILNKLISTFEKDLSVEIRK